MKRYKYVLIAIAYVVALFVFAWAGYYSYADYTMHSMPHKHQSQTQFQTDLAYVDLPRISITLTAGQNNHAGSVRMDITLEVDNQFVPQIVSDQPRITDRLIHYTQTLDYDDLSRPHSTIWLKPDMLVEVNRATAPVPVRDVIFKSFVLN